MGYVVGIDLGTTFTAAAVWRDGSAQISSLGSRGAAIPSVVLLREDERELTGEAADRRAMSEPERVAREFKRRLGDTTPILVGTSPFSAEALMARLLRAVIEEVATREGGPADAIAVCHPANWGPYKIDLLQQGIRMAGLPDTVTLLTEPEAAAISYATQQRIDAGQVVAVYDLGGGTFDAAVLRRTGSGFEILGQPEGIERLGGIDFDAAIFAHVRRSLGSAIDELDADDPAAQNAVARLRADCVEAKEALSSDTDASVPVMLPNIQTEVRITRAEFESMIRPSLVDSIDALRRALRSAGVEPDNVSAVLLVGGSSRIPLVAQLVSAEIGRPVAVDAHPKHAIALGAAYAAALSSGAQALPVGDTTVAAAPAAAAPAVPAAPDVPGAASPPLAAAPPPVTPLAPPSEPPTPAAPAAAAPASEAVAPAAMPSAPIAAGGGSGGDGGEPPSTPGPAPVGEQPSRAKGILIGAVAAVAVVVAVVVWALQGGDGGTDTAGDLTDEPAAEPADEPADESTTTTTTSTTTTTTTTTTVPPPRCDSVTVTELCINIEDVQLTEDGLGFLIDWEPVNFPAEPATNDFHAHFYWDTSEVERVGTQAAPDTNPWDAIATVPYDTRVGDRNTSLEKKPVDATAICVTPANSSHAVIDPTIFDCFDLPT